MSTLWHALLGLGDGRAAADARSTRGPTGGPTAAAARLRGELDEDAVHARTGCRLHSSYWPAKLAWLRETDPERFERVRAWVSPGEYVQRRLLGDAATSISMASGTGLLDQRTCRWDAELARGIEDRLPPIDDTPRSGLDAASGPSAGRRCATSPGSRPGATARARTSAAAAGRSTAPR